MKTLIFSLLSIILFIGCNKQIEPCATPPIPYFLRIQDIQGDDLLSPQSIGSYKDSLALLYSDGKSGYDTVQTDIESYLNSAQKESYQLNISGIVYQSWKGTKSFYLRRSRSITDTIYVDSVYENKCQPIATNEIKFNGVGKVRGSDYTGFYFQTVGKAPVK